MNPWELYKSRLDACGGSLRGSALQRECRNLIEKLPKNLSYKELIIDGDERNIAVINSDDFTLKTLCSLPGEDIPHGGVVDWKGQKWLITKKDFNTDVYATATMQLCNHLLKWVHNGEIVERWCVVEDGTKYLTGEYSDRDFIVTRGDARISVTITRDSYTAKLGRDQRFIIDDSDSSDPLAYRLTKPLRVGNNYNGAGVYTFIMAECNTEDTDNIDLRIANYYKYFPMQDENSSTDDDIDNENSGSADGDLSQSNSEVNDIYREEIWL